VYRLLESFASSVDIELFSSLPKEVRESYGTIESTCIVFPTRASTTGDPLGDYPGRFLIVKFTYGTTTLLHKMTLNDAC